MSKPTAQKKRTRAPEPARRSTPDRTIYIGLVIIGAFAVLLGWLMSGGKHAGAFTVGYVALLAWFINTSAHKAYRGAHLPGWQAALARLPLRCVGFGAQGHKPLTAAKGQPTAFRMIVISVVTSVVIIAVLAVLLVPELRPW